jgi:Plasmid pRiA4b ORF-3-like protein
VTSWATTATSLASSGSRTSWRGSRRLTGPRSSRAWTSSAQASLGGRAAPPDDCGGLYGYYSLLEIIADPAHPEHAEMCDWFETFGGVESARSFDPTHIDLELLDLDVRAALD